MTLIGRTSGAGGDDVTMRVNKGSSEFGDTTGILLDEEGIEPTNNYAERMIRPAVLWRRTSQGTRTPEGSRAAATILTLVQTCRIQGRSAVTFMEDVVRAAWTAMTMPSLLPMNG